MILVTSSAGLTGRTIIRGLGKAGHPVRALIRRPEQEATVRAAGAREVAVADLLDASAVARATAGATAVYHICPRMSKDEIAIGETMIRAAEKAGVRHFVFHSAIHSLLADLPHHANKLQVERALVESELDYTILQPARYMQNVLAEWPSITERGVYPVPYSVDAPMCLVDLEDVAEAAGLVTGNPAHAGATYGLHGADTLSAADEARVLGEALKRPVVARQLPLDEWRRAAEKVRTLSQIDLMLRMFAYYDRHGLRPGNPGILAWLLGRRPTTYAEFVARSREGSAR